jgi:uncharacterized membrane protein
MQKLIIFAELDIIIILLTDAPYMQIAQIVQYVNIRLNYHILFVEAVLPGIITNIPSAGDLLNVTIAMMDVVLYCLQDLHALLV